MCSTCGLRFTTSPQCACCLDTTRCRECCGHGCCDRDDDFDEDILDPPPDERDERIELVRRVLPAPEPYFAFPAASKNEHLYEVGKHKNVGIMNSTESLEILSHTYPASNFNPKGFTKNSSRRFAAAEIECCNYASGEKINRVIRDWHCAVVDDGSVYGAEGRHTGLKGFEINTTPACGNVMLDQIQ